MPKEFTRESLPSGKVIMRCFDKAGVLIEESHAYGAINLCITFAFRDGVKTDEAYFSKSKMVSRKTTRKRL